MNITIDSIIPITYATKHFKSACQKTKSLGTTFIFKNNKPDIVMMDIDEYNYLISALNEIEHNQIYDMVSTRNKADTGKRYNLEDVIK